jgi:hypothetical protein
MLLIASILQRGSNQSTEMNLSLMNWPMRRLTKRKKEGANKVTNTRLPKQQTNQTTNQRNNEAT